MYGFAQSLTQGKLHLMESAPGTASAWGFAQITGKCAVIGALEHIKNCKHLIG